MRAILLFIFIISSASLFSQSTVIRNIDQTDYPQIKADLYVWDNQWKRDYNLSAEDFEIFEDGIERQVLNITCPTKQTTNQLSTVMMIDASGSMNSQLINLAKLTARAWINEMPENGGEMAICSFNTRNILLQDFTNDKNLLETALGKINPTGGTDFNAAFIKKAAGALVVADSARYRPVIIFITDGASNGDKKEIIEKAQSMDATIYCISLRVGCPPILRSIALETGGEYFEHITTSDEMTRVYKTLLEMEYGDGPCEIEWISAGTCQELRYAEVNSISYGCSDDFTYKIQKSDVARLEIDPIYINCGGVEPGTTFDTLIHLEAVNATFSSTDIILSDDNFSISPSEFTINDGESIDIKLTYNSPDSGYRFCYINIDALPCSRVMTVIAGYPNVPPSVQTLNILSPNGGEVFFTETDTVIKWEGISDQDPVKIEYSTDEGWNWNNIVSSATGLEYKWENIPNTVSDKCLLRISQMGKTQDESLFKIPVGQADVTSMDWSPDNKKICYTQKNSYYLGLVDAETGQDISMKIDYRMGPLVCASWRPDGNTIAIGTDYGFLFFIDATTQELIHNEIKFEKDFFPIKLLWSPDVKYLATVLASGLVLVWDVDNHELQIPLGTVANDLAWSPDSKRLACSEETGVLSIWNVENGEKIQEYFDVPVANKPIDWAGPVDQIGLISKAKPLTAIYSIAENKIIKVLSDKLDKLTDNDIIPSGIQMAVCNGEGLIYIWDIVSGSLTKTIDIHDYGCEMIAWSNDGNQLAVGGTMEFIYIIRQGSAPLQTDISDNVWAIVAPDLSSTDIDMGQEFVSNTKVQYIPAFLENNNKYPIHIDSIHFAGVNETEFSISPGYLPELLPGNASIPVEFTFTPQDIGIRQSEFTIYHQAGTITYNIHGEGINPGLSLNSDILDFGIVSLNNAKDSIHLIANNINLSPVQIDSVIMTGPDLQQFSFNSPPPTVPVAAGGEYLLDLKFAPKKIGRTSGGINIYYDGYLVPLYVQLHGTGMGAKISIPDDSAYAGQRLTIKAYLNGVDAEKFQEKVSGFDLHISFDKTLLAPVDRHLSVAMDNNCNYIKVSGPMPLENMCLAEIPFVAGLGINETTAIQIDSVVWYNSSGDAEQIETELGSGNFKLLGICHDGGSRLINPNSQSALVHISPNPGHGELTIEYMLNEKGSNAIVITDLLGQTLRHIDLIPQTGVNIVKVGTNTLPQGQYFVQLRTPTALLVKPLLISK